MSSEGNDRSHLTPETSRGYLGGRLDSTAMHQIETHLLECEFCSDAVEGFELYEHAQVRTEQTLLALRKDLNQKIREHKQPRMIRWPVWSAAAGIALAIAGYVVIKQQEKEQQLAAIRQSEAFLQTGVNDTLIIFMPEAPEPVNKEKFLAVNTPPVPQANASSGQAAVSALPDSPKAGDSVSVVLSARQKRAPITGSVAIRGLKKQAGQPPSAARVISGRVVTSDNSSLPGANVLVPGTGLGTRPEEHTSELQS